MDLLKGCLECGGGAAAAAAAAALGRFSVSFFRFQWGGSRGG